MEKFNLQMIQDGAIVLVGLSGGADSVALAHKLKQLEEKKQITVVACHLNHRLRGEESSRDFEFVQNFCNHMKIPLFYRQLDIASLAQQQKLSIEECGRQQRYLFFQRMASLLGQQGNLPVQIATAHTLSDNLETILFYIARGTGLNGLCGIPKQRGNIIRPLLSVTRDEIEQYCQNNRLQYVIDSSNLSDRYTRNQIRHQIVPILKQINGSVESHIDGMVSRLSEDWQFLDDYAAEVYQNVYQQDGIDTKRLCSYHPTVRKRVLLQYLKQHELECSSLILNTADRMLFEQTAKQNFWNGKYLTKTQGILMITTDQIRHCYHECLLKDGIYHSDTGKTYKIKTLEIGPSQSFHKIYKNLFDISIDCGKICGSIIIRQRKDGDSIKLHYRHCTKSLKKLFQEGQIGLEERAKRFVLADRLGVIAVEGFGVDERVRCDKDTFKMIQLKERISE